jgi:rhamnulose-1-phosphate aldolase
MRRDFVLFVFGFYEAEKIKMDIHEAKFFKEFLNMTYLSYSNGWNERNGGNMSYRLSDKDSEDVIENFSFDRDWAEIGASVPGLKNEYFMVTGSGKYFRNTKSDPENNVAIIKIDDTGTKYKIVWGLESGGRPTSELPTHLMNHEVKKKQTDGRYRVIYHAHPVNLIALTYVLKQDTKVFTTELWDSMTECPIVFPKGVAVIPWMVPGGREIAVRTSELIKDYDIVVWCFHGAFVSGEDFDSAFGLMETVEKAAEIVVKVRSMGGKKYHLSKDDIMSLAKPYNVDINGDLVTDI